MVRLEMLYCKSAWVTSTIFWSSQLHACCVFDMLHVTNFTWNLIQSVVEKLLYFVTRIFLQKANKSAFLVRFGVSLMLRI